MAEDLSAEDIAFLKLLKKEVKEPPKGDETKDLQDWMKRYLQVTGGLDAKEENTQGTDKPKQQDKPTQNIQIQRTRDPPKISVFSGCNKKGEAPYELWKYEVNGLRSDKLYDSDMLNYAVRRSLKGDAGMIAMHLGPKASLDDIISKLDSIYGVVETEEDLLAQFYRARQEDDETVTQWSCRLENIMGRAVEKNIVTHFKSAHMLHNMLWNGLKTELKEISGYKYESIDDFDELRVALRQIEKDHEERKKTHKPNPSKAATSENITLESKIDEFTGIVQQLTTRFDRWERDKEQSRGYTGNYRGNSNYRGNNRNYRGKYSSRQEQPVQNRQWGRRPQQSSTSTTPNTSDKIVCYRCGQEGHKKIGCVNPVNKYRQDRDLNLKKPMEKGHR